MYAAITWKTVKQISVKNIMMELIRNDTKKLVVAPD